MACAEPDRLVVVVRDWGAGMGPRLDSPGLGLGLPTIATLAASFDVEAADGAGTLLRMQFPRDGESPLPNLRRMPAARCLPICARRAARRAAPAAADAGPEPVPGETRSVRAGRQQLGRARPTSSTPTRSSASTAST